MSEWIIVVAVILLPLVLYGGTRIVATAYFKSKREHTRSLLNDIDPGPRPNQGD